MALDFSAEAHTISVSAISCVSQLCFGSFVTTRSNRIPQGEIVMSCANYRWLQSVAVWSLIFVIHPFAALPFPASAQSGDESAIRNLAERFFTAYGSSD